MDSENEFEDPDNLRNKIWNFFRTFKSKEAGYKIQWIIRIFCWTIILVIAIYGAIKSKFNFFYKV